MPVITTIYATPVAIPPTTAALERAFVDEPDTQLLSLLDDGLLRVVLADRAVSPRAEQRLSTHLRLAAEAGSDGVLVSCSIYSPVLDRLRRPLAPLPILAIDEPMAEAAVGYDRIAIVGTARDGLDAHVRMVEVAAERVGRRVTIEAHLFAEAFGALTSGDEARHDRLVAEGIAELECDVVVLAQASMARLAEGALPRGTPVLTSPDSGARELARLVSEVSLTG